MNDECDDCHESLLTGSHGRGVCAGPAVPCPAMYVPGKAQRNAVANAPSQDDDDPTIIDLAFCCSAECTRANGIRIATYRGTGSCSIYIVCDECHDTRLTEEERAEMVEVRGAAWVRHLGLDTLHNGQFTKDIR